MCTRKKLSRDFAAYYRKFVINAETTAFSDIESPALAQSLDISIGGM
jgi:hypothetical protein